MMLNNFTYIFGNLFKRMFILVFSLNVKRGIILRCSGSEFFGATVTVAAELKTEKSKAL